MSPLFKKLSEIVFRRPSPYRDAPELNILVEKGNKLHVLLLYLLFGYSVVFSFINYLQGSLMEVALSATPCFFVIIEFILYKRGFAILSKLLNMLQVTTIVGLLSMVHSPETGVLAFYIPIMVGTQLTFFGRERIYAHILTVYILAALAFFLTVDIQFFPSLPEERLKVEWFVNFMGATIATVFEILFILSVSNRIQVTLFEKTDELNVHNVELKKALEENEKNTDLIKTQLEIIQQSQQEQAKLTMIATKAKSGVIITDSWGRIEWVNEAFTQITQYTLPEILGKKPKEFLQPENSNHPGFEQLKERLKNHAYVEVIVPNKKKDGSIYMNQLEINPVFNEKNELINFVSLQKDITEELSQQDEIKRANQRFELISEQASIGMWVWVPDTNKTIWNDILIEQYGAKREDIENNFYQFWQDSILTEDKERAAQNTYILVNGEKEMLKDQYRIVRKDNGEIRVLQTVTIAERNEKGHLIQMLGISQDITKEKELQTSIENKNAELQRANAELDRFVYSVSHDLRSPLLSIKGLLALIFDLERLDPGVENYLRMAEKSIHRLDDIIKEILEYSRNARTDVQYIPTNIGIVVEEIYEDLKYSVEEDFDFRIKHTDNDFILTDRARINTLLRNLIGNAVKYRKKRKDEVSFVEFRIRKENEKVILEVEDNAEGIAEKNKEKIFDMFFRASNTSTGTGLGLYICKQIVDKLSGKLELIHSQETGSLFRVTLQEYQKEV